MRDAARMQLLGMDGMRFLGADPRRPADEIERMVMLLVANAAISEQEKQASG